MITTAAHTIMSNAKNPRSTAYWELLEGYRAELIGQARAILGSLEDAEDVVQKTFIEAFSDNEKLEQAGSIGQWLRLLNRRNALDRAREKHRAAMSARERAEEATRTFTTGGFSIMELRDSVKKAVETLPVELRQIVALRYFEHLSSKEIAERLKIPHSTLKRQLFEANVLLHAQLKNQVRNPGTPRLDSEIDPNSDTGRQS